MIKKGCNAQRVKAELKGQSRLALAMLGLAGLVAGCSSALAGNSGDGAASTLLTELEGPGLPASPFQLQAKEKSQILPAVTATPWPSPTPWPTVTPWPTPAAWQPVLAALPALAPLPVTSTGAMAVPTGGIPVTYSPPDGVDVFGSTILRWTYTGQLAADEYFDIKIKPLGSNDSAFVDWTRSTEYELRPWSGWSPGIYTWQIGIIRGSLNGQVKQFIADTGRDSQPFIIKWQAGGGGSGGGNGGGSAAGGGGGNSSGGS